MVLAMIPNRRRLKPRTRSRLGRDKKIETAANKKKGVINRVLSPTLLVGIPAGLGAGRES